ncbi:hypothetical protein CDV31_016154 [Fusarium ambrosium]|uniref:5'-3' DNA helicase ZGRF1-like N-terminal domain-containing protein n=1 Tax=Fusarium ambrosium TaxID=131363 RepID=A0A428SE04_9HYPO|nr:hypothetical protein CDV31_016154 [Fusarium ambrosium]
MASSPSLAMTSNPLPTSALVVDFICLFTHDLKRKQKRWQDGVLKYHTFNKRIMVYDDRGHFIGDAHWQEGGDLDEGDEFELDRGAAIVQVSDRTGQREQDLTDLLDKRAKDVERRRADAGTRTPGSTAATTRTPRNDQSSHFQLRHRPLTDLVGGASRIGRAVISPHSPYEARKMAISPGQQQESPSEDVRPSKRRRREESPPNKLGHARSLFGATLTLTPYASSAPSVQSQALRERTNEASKAAQLTARSRLSGVVDRDRRSSKLPPPPEYLAIADTNPAPHQIAPRRTLPQRASLRELLAGNEQNFNHDRPRQREANHQGHKGPGQASRSCPSPLKDVVASVPAPAPAPKNRESQAVEPPANERIRKKRSRQPSESPSSPKDARASEPAQDSVEPVAAQDEAFESWLQQSEENSSRHEAPVQPPRLRSSSPRDSETDTGLPARERTRGDDGPEKGPLPNRGSKRAERTTSKPLTKEPTNKASGVRGTKRALSAETAAAPRSHADDLSGPVKEPRTELRIRSRQRRGLLMVSEKKDRDRVVRSHMRPAAETIIEAQRAPPIDPPSASDTEEPSVAHSRVMHRNLSGDAASRRSSMSSDTSHTDTPDLDDLLNSNNHPVVAASSLEKESHGLDENEDDEAAHKSDAASANSLEDDMSPPPQRRRTNPTRRSRPKPAQPVSSDEEEAMAVVTPSSPHDAMADGDPDPKPDPKPKSGPRITKMARKSVRSKEIIGFTLPTDDFPPTVFTTMSNGTFGKTEAEKTEKTEKMGDAEVTQSHINGAQDPTPQSTTVKCVAQSEVHRRVSDKSQGKQPPRLINPATRGKKAARKEDAAGLPPQPMVQLDPAAPTRIIPAARAPATKRMPSGSHAAQSALPGFSRANGGAWSRHAEDLLGMTRPSRSTSRR